MSAKVEGAAAVVVGADADRLRFRDVDDVQAAVTRSLERTVRRRAGGRGVAGTEQRAEERVSVEGAVSSRHSDGVCKVEEGSEDRNPGRFVMSVSDDHDRAPVRQPRQLCSQERFLLASSTSESCSQAVTSMLTHWLTC